MDRSELEPNWDSLARMEHSPDPALREMAQRFRAIYAMLGWHDPRT